MLTRLCQQQVFGVPDVNFSGLPELVNRCLSPADPIILQHVILVEQATGPNTRAYDVDVDMDDPAYKQKLNQLLVSYGAEAQSTLSALEDEVRSLA